MKMLKVCIAVIVVAFSVLPSSCKKKDTPPKCETITKAPQEYLDFWYFPKGSWWVYQLKDSSPAVYDTVICEGSSAVYSNPGAPQRVPCEMIYEAAFSHTHKTFFPGNPSMKGWENLQSVKEVERGRWVVVHDVTLGTLHHPGANFIYPYEIGTRFDLNQYTVADTSQISVTAGIFPRTVHFVATHQLASDSSSGSYITDSWRSKGVGLVKISYSQSRSTLSNTTWELVNYHMNR